MATGATRDSSGLRAAPSADHAATAGTGRRHGVVPNADIASGWHGPVALLEKGPWGQKSQLTWPRRAGPARHLFDGQKPR